MAEDSKQAGVGERYAQALFELARDADRIAPVENDLKALKRMREESLDLRRLLASPAFTAEDKSRALNALAERAGFDPLVRKFLGLLAANRRVAALPAVIDAYIRLSAQHRGATSADVVTAAPLSEAQTAGLRAALRQALGKDPEISTRVDPALLGGLKVRVGSRLYDASLKTRLDHLKFALKRA